MERKTQRTKASQYNVQMMERKEIPRRLSLDPAFAPGVSHWKPGGFSTREPVEIIHGLKVCIPGLDGVEFNLQRDPLNVAASAAVKIFKEVFGGEGER